jgi:hypothetical protein
MMTSLDDEWENFNSTGELSELYESERKIPTMPRCTDIKISTKVMVMQLDIRDISIYDVYWKLDTIKYWEKRNGIIKKQIKYTSYTKETYDNLLSIKDELSKKDVNLEILVLKHVDNNIHDNNDTESTNKFKNISKLTIGMSKKDMFNVRTKKKGAFYNCFMLVIRVFDDDIGVFREINIKIFNTGKMSFPGMLSDKVLQKTFSIISKNFSRIYGRNVSVIDDTIDTVLMNSNFNCGYFLDRDKLYSILKYEYRIHSNYEACSYPGIQCKYYKNDFNTDVEKQGQCVCTKPCSRKGNGTCEGECLEISFMIFRTGSILIVGKSDDKLLYIIYEYLKRILSKYYQDIFVGLNDKVKEVRKKKTKKRYFITDKLN